MQKIKSLVKHPLFAGSAVMIIGSNFANAIAYLYHLIIGRLLGPASYGELSSMLSLLGLLFASFNFLGLVIVKFVSSANKNEVGYIFSWFSGKSYILGLGLGIILMFFSPTIANFLHIPTDLALLVSPIVFFAFLTFVFRSFAQGLLKFWAVVISMNIDLIVRLVAGVLFIYLGFSVFGTVLGIAMSTLVTFTFLRWATKSESRVIKTTKVDFGRKVMKYSVPVLVATLTLNSMFSTDVILVKHFFDAHDAGIYSSLSTLGRIIFYGTGPVSAVMFPLIARKYSEKKNSDRIFYLSLLMTFMISGAVLLIYYLFPKFSINLLFGSKYLEGAEYLHLFGIFMTLYAAASLIFNYFLSIEKTSVVYFSVIASVAQVLGIVFWHKDFYQVITVSIYSSLFFLIALLIFYRYHTFNEKIAKN